MITELMSGLTVAVPVVAAVGVAGVLARGYVKAPPDKALIISGARKKPKVLIGKAGVKIPFFERVDELSLKLIPLDIRTGDAVPTADCINIYVDSAVNVKIGSTPEMVEVAAKNFLNKTSEEVGAIVAEVLEGNIREIICTMKLRELIGDRKTFVEKVSENVIPDLQKMGLELISFNVQRFSDANHVIEDLGIDNISQIKKDAAIAKANADKEVAIANAVAEREANDARVKSDTEIAERQNELAIKKSELLKQADSKRAEAAYDIQKEEQRRTVEIATANANLARQEKEIELKEREVAIKEKVLEATVKKQAEAEKYAAQQKADADQYERQKQAEAELFETQKEAEAQKARAEAERFAKEQEAEAVRAAGVAEADAISAKGIAEAEAIKAKAEAEAAGILKKAEAMKEYGDAAKQQMELDTLKVYFEQLPKIAAAIGDGYANVGEIKMFGDASGQLANNIMSTMTQVTEGVKSSTGIDINALISGLIGGKVATSNQKDVDEAPKEESDYYEL